MRGLRKILGIEHEYYPRVSNQEVLQLASDEQVKVKELNDVVKERRLSLFAHGIRAAEHDPIWQVTFENQNTPRDHFKKRVDRPKYRWIGQAYEEAANKVGI